MVDLFQCNVTCMPGLKTSPAGHNVTCTHKATPVAHVNAHEMRMNARLLTRWDISDISWVFVDFCALLGLGHIHGFGKDTGEGSRGTQMSLPKPLHLPV